MNKIQKNLGKKVLEKSFENKKNSHQKIDFKKNLNKNNKTRKKIIGNDKSSPNLSKPLNNNFLVKSSKNLKSNIHNFFIEHEGKAEKKVLNNKRKFEITNLCEERERLQKIMLLTKDITSLRLISQRIIKLNNKILKLIRIQQNFHSPSEIKKQKIKVKKNILKNNFIDSEKEYSEYSENEYKSDIPILKQIKKVNNSLKIKDIYHKGQIIDIHTNLSTIKDKPSYNYQREKISSLFIPSTDLSSEKRKLGITTIFNKSFRPIGFTQKSYLECGKKDNFYNTLDDIFYYIDEKSKRKNSSFSASIKKTNEKNDISQRKTATCSARSKQKQPRVTLFLENKKKKQLLNISDYLNNDDFNNSISKNNINTLNNNHNSNSKLEISDSKSNSFIKSKINGILNNSYIIKDSIERKKQQEEKQKKKDDNILLKLADKIKPKTAIVKKKKKFISQENEYVKRLKVIPKSCKEEYRECFKKILFEDRLLNHPQKNNDNLIIEKMNYLKELKKIKEDAQKKMFILGENIVTGRDDKEVIKEEKIFGNYGNITGLEYLIKKKSVLYEKNKTSGAYNPKDKYLVINYPI